MRNLSFTIAFTLMLSPSMQYAQSVQTSNSDSTRIDTLLQFDSVRVVDDALTENQRRLLDFEEKYREHQLSEDKMTINRLSFHDSLANYFLPERLNGHDQRERSFFHDAGDYFRAVPAFFGLDHQDTPMRQTVQPFGLSGNRMNVIVDGYQLRPFEHIPEPDGLIDFNDIPTALDEDIFVLPGAAGALFGGDNVVATLLTRPRESESFVPISAFLVDKGDFGYSYARGRYSNRFRKGREIDLSVGYRNAGFPLGLRDDDAYHIYGKLYFPLRERSGISSTVELYDREGTFAVRPDAGGTILRRERIDKSVELSYYRYNENADSRIDIGYRSTNQESILKQPYDGKFRNRSQVGFVRRDWISGSTLFRAELNGNYDRYQDGGSKFERLSQSAYFTAARLVENGRYAFRVGQQWVENAGMLPSLMGLYLSDNDKLFYLFSIGYTTKAPDLHQLNLKQRQLSLYGSLDDYSDLGNLDLSNEKQFVASFDAELGSVHNNIGISVTGGRIVDGIDWQTTNSVGQSKFQPANGDIDFLSSSARLKLRLNNFFHLTGGGAFNSVKYDKIPERAYTPEYHFFSGGEIHIYWRQKLIDLFAYGEIVYVGPYQGYSNRDLGDQVVFNAKLSFRMGKFRFHYVFQNIAQTIFESRENFKNVGRSTYYGFVWDFMD